MKEVVKFSRPTGFFDTFERRPGPIKTNMHYCPGCGHGILHKLIAEAIADLNIKDRTVLIAPVGCSVFAYYYLDCRAAQQKDDVRLPRSTRAGGNRTHRKPAASA
ncbi:MAG: hypothetical protein IJC73_04930, partial [Lentisphaeria bacterium]|nr:hypothetical protein [Lentisphaeria bacterium]